MDRGPSVYNRQCCWRDRKTRVLCKKSGSWTSKLYEMAKVGGKEGGVGREVTIMMKALTGMNLANCNNRLAHLCVTFGDQDPDVASFRGW